MEKILKAVNSHFKCLFEKKMFVCLSVCLTFFESADARDLGLITLFIFDLRHLSKLGHFLTGMIHFFIFTAKKELTFFFQMAPTTGLYDQYFSSYDFLNLYLFFHIFGKIDIFH